MKNKIIENLVKYPILFYALYFFYKIRPPFKLMEFSMGKYEEIVHYILILWGIVIVGYNLFFRRNIFFKGNSRFILLWLVVSLFTIISNISYVTTSSIKSLILTMFSILFFFVGYPLLREKYSDRQIFKYIFYPTLIFRLLINIGSIYLYMANISIFVIRDDLLNFLGVRYVGIADDRYTPLLYGLYTDPNFTAMTGVLLIFIAIYIYTSNKINLTVIEKLFIYSSVSIEFLIVAFSNSRGTLYSLLVVIIIYLIIFIIRNYNFNSLFVKSTLKKIGIVISVMILIVVSYIGVEKIGSLLSQNSQFDRYIYAEKNNSYVRISPRDLEQEEFSKHKNWILEYEGDNETESSYKDKRLSITKEDSGEELGNGRVAIWKDALKLFSEKPIFGISPKMQKDISEKKYSNLDIPAMKEGRSTHNSYVAVLLYYGILGFVVLGIVIFRILLPVFINEIRNGSSAKSVLFYGILFALTASFFLEAIFINIDFEQIYLMFLLGTMNGFKVKGEN